MDNKINQTKIIYLQRQGTSRKLNSNNAINDKLHYFICIKQRPIATEHEKSLKRYVPDPNEGKYSLEIRYWNDEKMCGDKVTFFPAMSIDREWDTYILLTENVTGSGNKNTVAICRLNMFNPICGYFIK